MKRTYVLLLMWVFLQLSFQCLAQTATISGYLTDVESGEPLLGANIFEPVHQQGTTTNEYGFFSLTLPIGKVQLRCSYIGYQTLVKELSLETAIRLNLQLQVVSMNEVVVTSPQVESISQRPQMSSVSLPIQQIEAIPMIAGESDVLKALSLTPGVSTGTEGSTGLFVRGGTPDQNLILLDGATVYNPSHLFGFLSVFNTDALNKIELIKGGFPARYGGRLSSVLDISMKEGNQTQSKGKASIGILSSKILWESPLGKKASYLVSARSSYVGLFVLPSKVSFLQGRTDQYLNYTLFDVNAKINYRFKDESQIFLSAYTGNDFFVTQEGDLTNRNELNLNWGNLTASLRYQKPISSKLFSHAILTYTQYQHLTEVGNQIKIPALDIKEQTVLQAQSKIQDLSAKFRLDYLPSTTHTIRAGGEVIQHWFNPSIYQYQTTDSVPIVLPPFKTFANTELAIFAEDEIKLTPSLNFYAGLRYAALHTQDRWYGGFEPRLAIHYPFSIGWSIKGSYTVMHQYIHLLSNNSVGVPNDIWVPVTEKIPPQKSSQYAIELTQYLHKWDIEASLGTYFKTSSNLIDYQEGANFLIDFSTDWQNIVESGGRGRAYGVEFFLHKKTGKFNGWLGYTLAYNERRFNAINQGEWYSAKYDRRHDFEITGSYQINPRWSLATTWVYQTGAAITLPSARYESPTSGTVFIHTARNAHRMPPYHRLDFSLTFRPTRRSSWNLSIYNVYNRKNPFYLQVKQLGIFNPINPMYPLGLSTRLVQKSLFPILPSLSYSFSF